MCKFIFRLLSDRKGMFVDTFRCLVSSVSVALLFEKNRAYRTLIVSAGLVVLIILPCIVTTLPASATTSSTLNFQARLETSSGAIVPDGNYNVEFKLYDTSTVTGTPDQGACTYNGGTTDPDCLWVETRTGGNQVRVVNGYLTVNLGSVNPFGAINWDQQLYLTMRIGGTGTPSWDAEMSPRIQLTAVPYAFQSQSAQQLQALQGSYTGTLSFGTLSGTAGTQAFQLPDQGAPGTYTLLTQNQGDSRYIQNTTSPQTANFDITGTGQAATFQAGTSVLAPLLDTATAGTLNIGTATATAVTVGSGATTINLQGNVVQTSSTTSGDINSFTDNSLASGSANLMHLVFQNAYTAGAGISVNGLTIGAQSSSRPSSGTNTSNLIRLITPSTTLTNGVGLVYNGIDVQSFALSTQTSASASFLWNGANIAMPDINQATGSLASNGISLTTGAITTGGTQTGILLNAAGVSAGTLQGIAISSITAGAGSETAFSIGSGWDTQISGNGFTIGGSGATTIQNTSTSAFRVQNASANLFTVDTSNTAIVLGNDGTTSALTVRGGAATGTNAAGSNIIFDASDGTGTGGSGALIFRTAAPNVSTITYASSASASSSGAVGSLQFPLTVNNNQNLAVIIGVNIGDKTKTVQSVTYNGVNLTKLAGQSCSGGTCHIELWYLAGSSVYIGTANVTVTLTAGTAQIDAGASVYYNVDPVTPIAISTTAAGNTNPSSTVLSGTTTQELVVDVLGDDNRLFGTAGSNTVRWNTDPNFSGMPVGSSDLAGAAGSTTMQWSDASSHWATVVAALSPPAGTSSNTLQDRLHIAASGNVGINTATPQYTLDVTGTGQFSTSVLTPTVDTSSAAALNIGMTNANAINLGKTTSNVLTTINGTVLVKPTTGHDSTTAFQVQKAGGASLFTVDTSNTAIVLGNDTAPSALTVRGGAASGNNQAGSAITFDASNGTGSGGSGDFIFRTAAPISTAVTLDNAIHGDDSSGGQVVTYTTGNFTVANHTNRLLLVSISTTGTTAVSSVTYGSDTLTRLTGLNSPSVLGGTRLEVWYKLNPTIQTATVTVNSGTGTHFSVGVASYYNVDQSVPTYVTTTGSTSSTSLPLTTTTAQLVYDTIAADNSGVTSNTSGATTRWNDTYVTEDAGQDKAGLSGTTTMSWNTPSSGWAELAIALNPVANSSSDVLTDRLHITAAGNVGINNTNPQYALSVGSTLNVDTTNLRLNVGAGATGEATPSLLVLDSQTGSSSDPTEIDGAMYYNATLQEFRCGRNGVWSSCGINPIDRGYDIEDDFMGGNTTITPAGGDIGQLGWTCAGGGTSAPTVAYNTTLLPTADRPGILQINSSATSGSGCTLVTGSTGSMIINNTIDIKSSAAVGSTTTNNILRIGAHSESTANTRPISGIWWEADNTTNTRWEYCYGNGTAATCAPATTGNGFASNHTIAASTFVRLEIRVLSSTSAAYCINGDCITKTGINIDETNAVSPAIACFNSSAAARACYVDYYQIQGVASAAR